VVRENGASKIGCFDRHAGTFREFALPAPAACQSAEGGNRVGRVTLDGTIADFAVPTVKAGPDGIVLGPDDNIWFSEGEADRIARVTCDGRVTEFGAGMTPRRWPLSIVVRNSARVSGRVARMTLDGEVTEFPIPTPDSQPRAMALLENGANALGRIHGRRYDRRVRRSAAQLRGVTAAANGDLWFTENFANRIGRMDSAGATIAEYDTTGARCIVGDVQRPPVFHAV
jgi:virginiamycin B lyase